MSNTEAVLEIAKQYGGREVSRTQPKGRDYVTLDLEFRTRKGAKEFSWRVSGGSLTKYAPFLCDEFKYARVSVFPPVDNEKEDGKE